MRHIYCGFCVVLLAGNALASVGDTLPEFEDCLQICLSELCLHTSPAKNFCSRYQDNPLLLLLWPCEDDCTYQCVQHITDIIERQGDSLIQFYGKWPFYRTFGFQEFVSVLFLAANLYVNARSWRFVNLQYHRSIRTGYGTMYAQALFLIAVLVIGWSFSMIYHTRDTALTETLDYFGAFAIVCANFNLAITSCFRLFEPSRRRIRQVCQFIIFLAYCTHCLNLLRDWDYGYNTLVSVVMGLVCFIIWVMHSFRVNREYHDHYYYLFKSGAVAPFEARVLKSVRKVPIVGWWASANPRSIGLLPIFLHLFLLTGLSLELLEFEPWYRLVDAHSLWHLVTFFAPFVWYDWIVWETEVYKALSNERVD